ncbi:hypothetical protein dsx2_2651 [Desulfovibrio sp. X2]|uniref:hypothetical protein n=1 Tax=Desulfovibrio sp. X2 TaxID=941449 RepID=UPI000358D18B|nr:hypothetical protein [Desulfovibrio sp. X2]EPR42734.1 hypothetical protein dsx2_2651 [Desulfovibrio sp. X2]
MLIELDIPDPLAVEYIRMCIRMAKAHPNATDLQIMRHAARGFAVKWTGQEQPINLEDTP